MALRASTRRKLMPEARKLAVLQSDAESIARRLKRWVIVLDRLEREAVAQAAQVRDVRPS